MNSGVIAHYTYKWTLYMNSISLKFLIICTLLNLAGCAYTTFKAPDGTAATNFEFGTDIKGLSGLHLTDGTRSLSIDSLQSDQSTGVIATGASVGTIVGTALKAFVKP